MSRYLSKLGISSRVRTLVAEAEAALSPAFRSVETLAEANQYKVIDAFREENIELRHFSGTNGYGYDDAGRQALARVFARAFGAQSAVLSPHIASGTHAISLALFGVLRPLDTLVSATGRPYDTINGVIDSGQSADTGSLADFAVHYVEVPLIAGGAVDTAGVLAALHKCEKPKAVFFQRSRGYAWRKAFSVLEIQEFAIALRREFPNTILIVDNCYGEFCETQEPSETGADLIAGSLIKNPGGGIAPTGGYIAGKKDYVQLVENRLTAPGLGSEVGSYEATYRPFFQGLFMAPHVVGEALKGSILFAKVFEQLGFKVFPGAADTRADITQSIRLKREDLLLAYTKGIQKAAAIDSRAVPLPWAMPGYSDPIVMAAGTFVQGASIELSADAPVKPPYTVYAQGGLTYAHMKLGLMCALSEMDIV